MVQIQCSKIPVSMFTSPMNIQNDWGCQDATSCQIIRLRNNGYCLLPTRICRCCRKSSRRVHSIWEWYLQKKCKLKLCVVLVDAPTYTQTCKWRQDSTCWIGSFQRNLQGWTRYDLPQNGWHRQPNIWCWTSCVKVLGTVFPTRICKWWKNSTCVEHSICDRYLQKDTRRKIEIGLIRHNHTQICIILITAKNM